MGAIFGGRNPAPHAFIPGGITSVPTAARITSFRTQLTWLTNFIQTSYIPNVEDIANAYPTYFNIGAGYKRLLAFGVFNQDNAGTTKLLKSGYADAGANTSSAFSAAQITEQVQYSWYSGSSNLAPASGVTTPVDPNTKPTAYSWLKAPRYNGLPVEVGPLARMWINGDYRGGVSVMHRHLARAYETLKIANAMTAWLNALAPGQAVVTSSQVPSSGTGVGLSEAPRGALGHWVQIAGGTISKYQIVTPTCWNASPMDGAGVAGPLEKALIGTPVKNPAEPVEVLRVVHSYDPCLSCAVHVMSPEGKPEVVYHPDRAMA
jgi:hydrogenase large subunit